MEIESIKLSKSWDGREYVLLHQSSGFHFRELRFTNAIIEGNEYCILWNNDFNIDPDLLEAIKKLVVRRRKLKEESKEAMR